MATTMDSIKAYILTLTQPIERDAIYRHFLTKDDTITRGDVTKALKEMGFVTTRVKVSSGCGIALRWVKTDEDVKDETSCSEPKVRTTEDAIEEAENKNERMTSANARLLETLSVSRGLREEMIARQQDCLIEMARRILGLYGSDKERKTYGVV